MTELGISRLPNRYRSVRHTVDGIETRDGANVRLTRMIGSPALNRLDPFLLLDVFESDTPDDYVGGFPPHPHRGFETLTYLLAGRMRHEDSRGNRGLIEAGGGQWMSAGSGIVHSEIPEQIDGLMRGVQLWINLPSRLKMNSPTYQDFNAGDIPVDQHDGAEVRVIAGQSATGVTGPIQDKATQPLILDVSLRAGGTFEHSIPDHHTAFIYMLSGDIVIYGDTSHDTVVGGQLAVLDDGNAVSIAYSGAGARIIVASARPIGEPIARGGPFVMNTKKEILQAFADHESGKLGKMPEDARGN